MSFQKIDKDSKDSVSGAVDFFNIPPTNVTVASAKVYEILPSNPVTDKPYHFKVHSSQEYVDLSKCYVWTEFRIRRNNAYGNPVNLIANEDVAAIQMPGLTFMNNLRIAINGREIFDSNSLMAYKTYLSHELSFPATTKDSYLGAAGYYRDTGDSLEAGDGYNNRKTVFAGSGRVQCMAKLDADLFNQPQYLISHCDLDITIMPNESNFMVIAPVAQNAQVVNTYSFEVVGIKLYVKKLTLMDGLSVQLSRNLELKPARYAIRKTMMKSLHITQGTYEYQANLFTDQVPRRITLGLVSNADYVGSQQTSPFNFKPYDVREISIQANGRTHPQAPYVLDYPHLCAVRPFVDSNEAIGFGNSQDSNGITYGQFCRTHTIYVFNLSNSQEVQGATFDLIKQGNTAVSIKFRNGVPVGGLVLIVMAEMDQLLMVDRNRDVASDTMI